ncbi:hypothetical protein AXFE_15860 [Acidithrix ferrooxidans]|uniref:Uncharacterized protein n=1 Tax=Acidithrix ferrooxidans TaxID=1280514 RepID=A0A0D8HID2_9ACTN|nr:hypothetical protein AXFE_15860 [Acidithrix ferrooxidans]
MFLVGKEVGAFKLWNYLGIDQKIYPVGAVGWSEVGCVISSEFMSPLIWRLIWKTQAAGN